MVLWFGGVGGFEGQVLRWFGASAVRLFGGSVFWWFGGLVVEEVKVVRWYCGSVV